MSLQADRLRAAERTGRDALGNVGEVRLVTARGDAQAPVDVVGAPLAVPFQAIAFEPLAEGRRRLERRARRRAVRRVRRPERVDPHLAGARARDEDLRESHHPPELAVRIQPPRLERHAVLDEAVGRDHAVADGRHRQRTVGEALHPGDVHEEDRRRVRAHRTLPALTAHEAVDPVRAGEWRELLPRHGDRAVLAVFLPRLVHLEVERAAVAAERAPEVGRRGPVGELQLPVVGERPLRGRSRHGRRGGEKDCEGRHFLFFLLCF